MKKSFPLILMFLFILSLKVFPQTNFHYSYDAAGNRTERIIYLEKGGSKGPENPEDAKTKTEEVIEDDTFKPLVLKIYPNPTTGLLRIEIPSEADGNINVRIRILDINGRIILDKTVKGPLTEIDLSSQPDGIYMLTFEQGSVISKWKVIKR